MRTLSPNGHGKILFNRLPLNQPLYPHYLLFWGYLHLFNKRRKSMDKGNYGSKSLLTLVALLSLIFAAACTEVRLNLNTIPVPPPTTKLRVFIQPVSGYNRFGWKMPQAEYARINIQAIGNFFSQTGIYEVIEEKEVDRVLGKQPDSPEWARKDWDLARQVGRALHAEYAMIVERSILGDQHYWAAVLINVETGRKYKYSTPVTQGRAEDYQPIVRLSYQAIFSEAKNDLLATAIRKGRLAGPEIMAQQIPVPKGKSAPDPTLSLEPPKPTPPPSLPDGKPSVSPSQAPVEKVQIPRPVASPERIPPKEPIPSPAIAKEAGLGKAPQVELQAEGGNKLAVYDLEAIEANKVVALILTEALRHELFKLKLFHLVNRENIVSVLEEMALQKTGLVDEKEAVKAGKGLAAQQIVLGRYGSLGKISVLQAKRLDVETQSDLGFGSLKCDIGREDELLQHMGELAKEIAGKK
jgi:hypothetical protein